MPRVKAKLLMDEEELPSLLAGAPLRFRTALKCVKAGADALHDLEVLAHTAEMERAGRRPCTLEVRCACRVLALEAQSLGDRHHIWETCAAHVETVAQAACHLASVRAWLAAREKTIDSTEQSEDLQLQHAAYLQYDANKYDFCGLVERMFAEHLPCDGGPERLARLHESTAAQRELGALGCASSWAATGLTYSKELDEATRYGCGIFNRLWKASALREDFMRLFERFVREVIAPQLESPDLVYQTVPIFRVFLPGHLAVGPRHTDAGYHEQPNELNFWVPLTQVHGTNSLFVESLAGRGDFAPVCAGPGVMYRFRGNACEHFTALNLSGRTRVSFDFRVIRTQDWPMRPVGDASDNDASRRGGADGYFRIGRYYKRLETSSHDQEGASQLHHVPEDHPPVPLGATPCKWAAPAKKSGDAMLDWEAERAASMHEQRPAEVPWGFSVGWLAIAWLMTLCLYSCLGSVSGDIGGAVQTH